MNQRGRYGKDQYLIGAEPVELSDVKAGAGIWLGFFAYIGWSLSRSLDVGISKVIEEFRKPRSK